MTSSAMCDLCSTLQCLYASQSYASELRDISVDDLRQNCETCTGFCRSIYLGISKIVSPAAQRKTACMVFGGGRGSESNFRVHGANAECDEETFRLEFFTDRDCSTWPLSVFLPGPVLPSRSDDTQCLNRILGWLQSCRDNHKQCQLVATPSNVKIRVLELQSTDTRLVENFDIGRHFVALSHCWGDTRHIITTKDLLPRHKQGIPLSQLPQTFRDAIKVCHLLQIRYLWIDSLCIIQDDPDDWLVEASKMQDVYKCAELVLAASAAKNSSQGLFQNRVEPTKVSGPSGSWPGTPISIFARTAIEHSQYTVAISEPAEREPLATRAWCLQEWLLARRLIHFSSAELVWDCRQEVRCECMTLDMQYHKSDSNVGGKTRELRGQLSQVLANTHSPDIEVLKCVRLWTAMVEEYTARDMTRSTDRMVAISGLAKELTSIAALQPYHAGLLHAEIARQLLWNRKETIRPKNRNANAVAPSWSWGSISESVETRVLWEDSSTSIDLCKIKDCAEITVLDDGKDQFRPVSGQTLHLVSQALHGTIQAQAVIDFGECIATVKVPTSFTQHEIFFTIDIDLGSLLSADIHVVFVKVVAFEMPTKSVEDSLCGSLVLLPSANATNHFIRIGVVLGDIPLSWYTSEQTADFYVT